MLVELSLGENLYVLDLKAFYRRRGEGGVKAMGSCSASDFLWHSPFIIRVNIINDFRQFMRIGPADGCVSHYRHPVDQPRRFPAIQSGPLFLTIAKSRILSSSMLI